MTPEQMIQLSNILFVIAVVFAVIAVAALFKFDMRKSLPTKRKRKKIKRVSPVTVELVPRSSYMDYESGDYKAQINEDWQIVQDITYIHTDKRIE